MVHAGAAGAEAAAGAVATAVGTAAAFVAWRLRSNLERSWDFLGGVTPPKGGSTPPGPPPKGGSPKARKGGRSECVQPKTAHLRSVNAFSRPQILFAALYDHRGSRFGERTVTR